MTISPKVTQVFPEEGREARLVARELAVLLDPASPVRRLRRAGCGQLHMGMQQAETSRPAALLLFSPFLSYGSDRYFLILQPSGD